MPQTARVDDAAKPEQPEWSEALHASPVPPRLTPAASGVKPRRDMHPAFIWLLYSVPGRLLMLALAAGVLWAVVTYMQKRSPEAQDVSGVLTAADSVLIAEIQAARLEQRIGGLSAEAFADSVLAATSATDARVASIQATLQSLRQRVDVLRRQREREALLELPPDALADSATARFLDRNPASR